ncbi:MAG: hypothetical protein FWD45_01475 [Coriobacteriia bacterium]|nr:hypothetical protein [Coriobacteriia bacterium]
MWSELQSQNDIDDFMKSIYDFHDSVLKELKYLSGAYVGKDLGMLPVNNQRVLRVIIQRQFWDPCAIEMEFIGLKYLKLVPIAETHTCEILDATMLKKDGYIYWCDLGGLTADDIEEHEGTLICAERVRWRPADEFIGPDEIYIASSNK